VLENRNGNDAIDLSIVVPMYFEEGNVQPLVAALLDVLEPMAIRYEIILINDGSTDGTWDAITAAADSHPVVRGISLSRNFGHQNAVFAGLNTASGRAVISMDGDLQHPPSLIPEMHAAWQAGHEIVETKRGESSDTSLFKRATSSLFYRVFSLLSGIPMSAGTSDFRLMDSVVVKAVCEMNDADLFLRGITHWVGFRRTTLPYQAAKRHSGQTKYSLARMIRFATSSLVSFSTIPLRIGIWVGLLTSLIAFLELGYIIYSWFRGDVVPGWASTITVISFMFGVLFIIIGIIGTYLASLFETMKNRPRFLVRDACGFDDRRKTDPDG